MVLVLKLLKKIALLVQAFLRGLVQSVANCVCVVVAIFLHMVTCVVRVVNQTLEFVRDICHISRVRWVGLVGSG